MKTILTIIIFFFFFNLSAQVPKEFFGIHIGGPVETNLNGSGVAMSFPPWKPTTARLWDTYGANSSGSYSGTGTGLTWASINTADGVYDWYLFDKAIAKLKAEGYTELMWTLGDVPTWAGGGAGHNQNPSSLTYITNAVTAIANRSIADGLPIKFWETWNEPNNASSWAGSINQMKAIAQTFYNAVKAVNSSYLVISPSCQGYPSDTTQYNPATNLGDSEPGRWTKTYLANGGGAYADIMGFHGYITELNVTHAFEDIGPMVDIYKGIYSTTGQSSKQIFDTESFDITNGNQSEQARFLAVTYILEWIKGVSRKYWYSWDQNTGKEWSEVGGINTVGTANKELVSWIQGAVVDNLVINGNVYSVDVTINGRTSKIVWNKSGNSIFLNSYTSYRTLAGVTGSVSGSVTIGKAPIILYNPVSTNWYFSTLGDVNNTGHSPFSPWPFSKLAALISSTGSVASGDSVLFRSGDTFYGSITCGKSNINFGSYGQGTKPKITGFVTLGSWVSGGANRWKTTVSGGLSKLECVAINGELRPKGRYPNAGAANGGYLTIDAHTTTSITDTSAGVLPGWAIAGVDFYMKNQRWTVEKRTITSRTGNTFNFAVTHYPPQNGWGYFLQNHLSTLDTAGEWYYNPTTSELTVYSTISPGSTVKAATKDTLVNIGSRSNIKIHNIDFDGSNGNAIYISTGNNITVNDCKITNVGTRGLITTNQIGLTALRDTIRYAGDIGVETNSSNVTINDINIYSIGIYPGMLGNEEGFHGNGLAIRHADSNITITNPVIVKVGMSGIGIKNDTGQVAANHWHIINPYIDSFNITKDDDGGFYTQYGNKQPPRYYDRYVKGGVIKHGIGNYFGTNTTFTSAYGVYADIGSWYWKFDSIYVEDCGRAGFFLNYRSEYDTLTNSQAYNNGTRMGADTRGTQLFFQEDDTRRVKNIVVQNNKAWAFGTQNLVYTVNSGSIAFDPGVMNSNYYAVSTTKPAAFKVQTSGGAINKKWNEWQALGHDNSGDTINTTTTSVIKTYPASGNLAQIIPLDPYKWRDIKKTEYNNFLVVPSYRSVVLQRLGLSGSTPPTVNIYSPLDGQNIISNTNIIISATAQDANGTIASVAFYKDGVLINTDASSPYSYTMTNVAPGTYTLTAKATDNDGLVTTSSPIVINVINSKPTVSITSPASGTTYTPPATINITGTASDANGSIARVNAYMDGVFAGTDNTSPYTFTLTGVGAGGKSLTLVAVDNLGDSTTSAAVSVTVAAANQPPAVSITLPTKDTSFAGSATVHFTGNASDPDGTVSVIHVYDNNVLIHTEAAAPWDFSKLIVGIGVHKITFVAVDNVGDSTTSAPRYITITSPNQKPIGTITFPNNDTSYYAPSPSFNVTSSGTDADGTITAIHLYRNGVLIGTGSSVAQSALPAGGFTYYVYFIDNSGDSARSTNTVTIQVVEQQTPGTDSLAASVQIVSPIPCNGGQATVLVEATGGVEPYTGTGTFTETGGLKQYIVIDANGLRDTVNISIYEPGALSATVSADTIVSYGGTVNKTVSAIGGTPNYSYSRDGVNFQTSPVFNLPAGSYTITVKDANGCLTTVNFVLNQPAPGCNCIIKKGRGRKTVYL